MAKNFLINGDKKNSLSPFDRGLAFGDGAFRTFLVENNKPKQWNAHYRKLAKDLKSIDIPSPSDKLLLSDIQKLFPEKGIFNPSYYYIQHFSKHVPKGSRRRHSSSNNVLHNVFIRPDGKSVVVLMNETDDTKHVFSKHQKLQFDTFLPPHSIQTLILT